MNEPAVTELPTVGQLRNLLGASPAAILVFDLSDQSLLLANAAASDMIGLPEAAVMSRQPAQIWEGADGARCQAALSTLALGAMESYRGHGQLRTKRGSRRVSIWVRRMNVQDGSVAIVILTSAPDLSIGVRSVEAFFGCDGQELASNIDNPHRRIEWSAEDDTMVFGPGYVASAASSLASFVYPGDIDRLSRAVGVALQTSEGVFLRLHVVHGSRGWVETSCLLLSLPDGCRSPALVPGHPETQSDSGGGSDAERIAILERHLLDFAAELRAGGWREARPLEVDPSRFAELDHLPARQREVVDRLLRGEGIESIGLSMFISTSTVRNHLSHVYNAFGVHSQSALLALLRSGPSEVPH